MKQNKNHEGIVKYVLPNGIVEETKIKASNEGNFYRNFINTVVYIREIYFNNQDFQLTYTGDCEHNIRLLADGYDLKKFANDFKKERSLTLIKR